MAQLTAGVARQFEFNEDPVFNDVPAKAAVAIYQGSAVGTSTGGRQLVAADTFRGFAEMDCDNTVGAALLGSKNIRVRTRGDVQLVVTSVASDADVGTAVYASDGNTFTLAATGNSSIGKVHRWITSTTCIVRFEAADMRSI